MDLSPAGYQFFKINIDFEYKDEIYSIKAEPYNTLLELKENISKKIFPTPRNIHCFYRNFDLYDKEDEQISMLFPLKKKIKIILKKPSKEKNNIKSYQYIKSKSNGADRNIIIPKIAFLSDSISPFKKNILLNKKNIINKNNNNNNKNNDKLIKKKLLSLSSMENILKKRKQLNMLNSKNNILENIGDEYFKGEDELFYYLHKNKINEFKLSSERKFGSPINEKNENEIDTKTNFNTDRKSRNKLKKLDRLSLFTKENKNHYNNIDLNYNNSNEIKTNKAFKELNEIERERERESLKPQNKENIRTSFEPIEKNENSEHEEQEQEQEQDEDTQEIYDANYICSLCNKNMITDYCKNCNQFICNKCIEKCKSGKHQTTKIKISHDCFENINKYAQFILSIIEKKTKDIQEYDKELKLYDIKKKRDNLLSMLNEIINLYSVISSILKKIYQEKEVKKAIQKYSTDSDKIKEEIGEIIKKADSYIKSDKNYNLPKYKVMNLKYFFDLINDKENNHKLITEKVQVYSLNSNINNNLEKSFNEIEEIMKKLSNKENPFDLTENLKNEYDKLIKENDLNVSKEKKKTFTRRKTVALDKIDLSKIKIPHFQTIKSID